MKPVTFTKLEIQKVQSIIFSKKFVHENNYIKFTYLFKKLKKLLKKYNYRLLTIAKWFPFGGEDDQDYFVIPKSEIHPIMLKGESGSLLGVIVERKGRCACCRVFDTCEKCPLTDVCAIELHSTQEVYTQLLRVLKITIKEE